MNEKSELTKQLLQAYFFLVDINLYCDTHPDDRSLDVLMDKYISQVQKLSEKYESTYGPLSFCGASGEAWLKAPWPWDNTKGEN